MAPGRGFDSRRNIPLRHLHNRVDLVALAQGFVAKTCLDLVVLLNQRAARTPIRSAAIRSPRSFDAEFVAYLRSIRHVVSALVSCNQRQSRGRPTSIRNRGELVGDERICSRLWCFPHCPNYGDVRWCAWKLQTHQSPQNRCRAPQIQHTEIWEKQAEHA